MSIFELSIRTLSNIDQRSLSILGQAYWKQKVDYSSSEDDVNKSTHNLPATTFVPNSTSATFEPDDEPLVEPWKDEIEENVLPFKFITYTF